MSAAAMRDLGVLADYCAGTGQARIVEVEADLAAFRARQVPSAAVALGMFDDPQDESGDVTCRTPYCHEPVKREGDECAECRTAHAEDFGADR